jgi:hypothetical protein
MTAACLILALTPLDAWVTHFLHRHAAPASTATVLDRVIKEGYSEGLHKLAAGNVSRMPDFYLNQLAFALSSAKGDHLKQGTEALHSARQKAPFDPMVLMYAGYISHLAGDADATEHSYSQLLIKQPKNATAMYNFSVTQADKAGFESSDLAAEAAKLKPALVSEFIKKNDHYYENNVPPLRSLIQPVIAPGYFWGQIFLSDLDGALNVTRGTPFFGLPPLITLVVFVTLFAALLVFDSVFWGGGSRIKRYFICRICGRLLCRRCRKGTMCSSCYKANLNSHNNAATMYNLQKKYQEHAQLRTNVLRRVLGMFFPGTEQLYKGETLRGPIITLLFTSAIFAALYCALTFHTEYPSKTVVNPIYFAAVLLIYNITAFLKNGRGLITVFQNHFKQKVRIVDVV